MEDARAVFETNFFGVVRMTNAVLPGMRDRREGRVINVGLMSRWMGEPGEAFYSASKQALAGYTEALHHEVWSLCIRVSLVEPGAFRTNILEAAYDPEGTFQDYAALRQAIHRTMEESLRRGGDPRKVAQVILKIARSRSPRLRYGAGPEALWIPYLRLLLPQRIFDYLLRRGFGI